MHPSFPRSVIAPLVAAVLGASLCGCEGSSGDKPVAGKPAATAGATGAAAGSGSAAAGSASTEQAASSMFGYLEKLSALLDSSFDPKAKDCKKLGEALTKFAAENAEAMGKIRDSAGGKDALARALQKAYGDKYDKAIDKYLEATQVECNGEPTVVEAAKKLGL